MKEARGEGLHFREGFGCCKVPATFRRRRQREGVRGERRLQAARGG